MALTEVLRRRSKIWVEKSARLHNLIILIIFPEGLKFSATFRRKIFELQDGAKTDKLIILKQINTIMNNELVRILKQLDIISREPVKLKTAEASNFYVDVKKAYGYPDALDSISDELWKEIGERVTCIATAGYGGLSPSTIISSRHHLYLTFVRDEPKKHGKGGWIDGYVPNEQDKIAIVDDVFTTGGSLRKIIEALEPTGAEILGCYVVVKRGDGNLQVPLKYLLTTEELL